MDPPEGKRNQAHWKAYLDARRVTPYIFIMYYVCSFWPLSHASTVWESSNAQYCPIPLRIADTRYRTPVSS